MSRSASTSCSARSASSALKSIAFTGDISSTTRRVSGSVARCWATTLVRRRALVNNRLSSMRSASTPGVLCAS